MSRKPIDLVPGGHVEFLLASAREDWDAAVNHRFVNELFKGSLDDGVLASYLVQDYQFFDAFLSMLGGCVAYADRVDSKLTFAAQLGMLADDEDGYFQKAFDELGVSEADQLDPQLTEVTKAFRAMMYDAANSQSYPDLLVMLAVAEWLYLDWGERGSTDTEPAPLPERYVHAGWVELHRGREFQKWCQFLVNELERVFPEGDESFADALTLRFQKAVALERGFFDVAYN